MTASRGFLDQVAVTLEVACETAYRSDEEQKAMLAAAWKVDKERFKDTTTNKHRLTPYLERLVDETRRLDSDQKEIRKPSDVHARKRS